MIKFIDPLSRVGRVNLIRSAIIKDATAPEAVNRAKEGGKTSCRPTSGMTLACSHAGRHLSQNFYNIFGISLSPPTEKKTGYRFGRGSIALREFLILSRLFGISGRFLGG